MLIIQVFDLLHNINTITCIISFFFHFLSWFPRRMQWTLYLSFKHHRMNKYLVILQGFCCIKILTKHLHDQYRCVNVFTFSVIINNICQFSSIALTARPKHLYATTNRKSLSKRHFFRSKTSYFSYFGNHVYDAFPILVAMRWTFCNMHFSKPV